MIVSGVFFFYIIIIDYSSRQSVDKKILLRFPTFFFIAIIVNVQHIEIVIPFF